MIFSRLAAEQGRWGGGNQVTRPDSFISRRENVSRD